MIDMAAFFVRCCSPSLWCNVSSIEIIHSMLNITFLSVIWPLCGGWYSFNPLLFLIVQSTLWLCANVMPWDNPCFLYLGATHQLQKKHTSGNQHYQLFSAWTSIRFAPCWHSNIRMPMSIFGHFWSFWDFCSLKNSAKMKFLRPNRAKYMKNPSILMPYGGQHILDSCTSGGGNT